MGPAENFWVKISPMWPAYPDEFNMPDVQNKFIRHVLWLSVTSLHFLCFYGEAEIKDTDLADNVQQQGFSLMRSWINNVFCKFLFFQTALWFLSRIKKS